ncbi:hypothetical protein EMCRGX_G032902 [Ephydatia muelleri]
MARPWQSALHHSLGPSTCGWLAPYAPDDEVVPAGVVSHSGEWKRFRSDDRSAEAPRGGSSRTEKGDSSGKRGLTLHCCISITDKESPVHVIQQLTTTSTFVHMKNQVCAIAWVILISFLVSLASSEPSQAVNLLKPVTA